MSTIIFYLREIKHNYNGRKVLDVEKLAIKRGEILAVIGPSGAGKSTLLRLLNFLEPPSDGQITFDGHLVTPQIPLKLRRRVTTVFQRPLLLKRSVITNLHYGINLRGEVLTRAETDNWLIRFGLMSLAESATSTLSAGEAQRVALARALLLSPEVLLLDEPTANLDPRNVELIEKIVREENEKRGTTVVIVTHNIFQARRLAHRTALLLDGELVEMSETETFFNSPQDSKAAAFLRGDLIY